MQKYPHATFSFQDFLNADKIRRGIDCKVTKTWGYSDYYIPYLTLLRQDHEDGLTPTS